MGEPRHPIAAMATILSIMALNSAGRMPKRSWRHHRVRTRVRTEELPEELSEELSEERPGGGEETLPPHGASRPSPGLERLWSAIAHKVEMPEELPPG